MFKFKQLTGAAILLALAMAASVTVRAAFADYLPLNRSELGRPFPVKYAGALDPPRQELERRFEIGVSGATLKQTEDADLSLTGSDRAGKAWSVGLGGWCGAGGGEAYTSDLDGNGLRDLVFVVATCGNGLAPSSHIIAVTFESNGRPLRFEVDGYFEADRTGIFDLRDMNGDGRAELIYMNFDDGYWITNLYTAGNARWRKINGRFGGRVYPLYTRFTNRPNRRAVKPQPGRRPFAPDLSNDAPHLRGQLRSYRWANVLQSEDVELNFETSRGQQVKCQPVSWYASFTVVMDDARGRNIFSLAGTEADVKKTLDEIVAGHYDVSLYGQRNKEGCSPEILWVTMK